MAIAHVFELLRAAAQSSPHFPPTELYNEGWLGRLVLHWFSSHAVSEHPLKFALRAAWYSEALLPSPFLPRFRADPLGETWTHADGVVGHFRIGAAGKADLSLDPMATQLVIIEAKLMAPLAAGVGRARSYDQAARNVACLVEVLSRANKLASTMERISFCVLAPQAKLDKGSFKHVMTPESIKAKVAARVRAYQGEKDNWYHKWFEPTLPNIELQLLS